jgi:cytochrome c peroxidase
MTRDPVRPEDAGACGEVTASDSVGIALRFAPLAARVDGPDDAVGMAVAAFEASAEVYAFSSKYDAYLAGRARLTADEALGLAMFQGKAHCSGCHVLENGRRAGALLTDFTSVPGLPFRGSPPQTSAHWQPGAAQR